MSELYKGSEPPAVSLDEIRLCALSLEHKARTLLNGHLEKYAALHVREIEQHAVMAQVQVEYARLAFSEGR